MNRHSSTTGMSALDLLEDIPEAERVLLKILLQNTTINKKEFKKTARELAGKKNISPKEIKKALKSLLKKEWLREDNGNYTLLQRKHRGSQIKKF